MAIFISRELKPVHCWSNRVRFGANNPNPAGGHNPSSICKRGVGGDPTITRVNFLLKLNGEGLGILRTRIFA